MWTDERVATVKRLWADGLSASQIAQRIGGVSRNAVIGKVHRMGLPPRCSNKKGRPARQPRPRKRKQFAPVSRLTGFRSAENSQVARKPDGPPLEIVGLPPPRNDVAQVTMEGLKDHHCRWPVGDPRKPGFGYCGCDKMQGGPYCAEHAAIAFVAVDLNKPKRPFIDMRRVRGRKLVDA